MSEMLRDFIEEKVLPLLFIFFSFAVLIGIGYGFIWITQTPDRARKIACMKICERAQYHDHLCYCPNSNEDLVLKQILK